MLRSENLNTNQDLLFTTLSEVAMLRALELAGSRLAVNNRPSRAALNQLPKWDVHTLLRVKESDLGSLLKGAWDIPKASGYPEELLRALDEHSRIILMAGIAYSRTDMLMTLAKRNLDASIFNVKRGS
ncbi:hypothetical protein ABVB69_05150 [Streptomyces sp. NPDC000349]|uniref:hypothetical protein n=1 Tax=unclassified Streptomyces TaxID=2593676 RepID=UPI00277E313E|nr:hypothetical protein [Streptomyces sp. DSM 40167]MDQ0404444.1 hypothetical protein [Streptomyces sp. DSM 40167]